MVGIGATIKEKTFHIGEILQLLQLDTTCSPPNRSVDMLDVHMCNGWAKLLDVPITRVFKGEEGGSAFETSPALGKSFKIFPSSVGVTYSLRSPAYTCCLILLYSGLLADSIFLLQIWHR